MKDKYKATPKTYASQPRRNGKVTASLAGLLARADVHVEEGELKSISTGSESRALSIYANGGVAGAPRWMNGENQFLPYVDRPLEVVAPGRREGVATRAMRDTFYQEVLQSRQAPVDTAFLRRTTFDPPVQVNANETLHLEGTGRVFIGNTEDPNNLREVGIARNVTVDFARGQDRTALVEVDFAGLETRVMNYSIQAAVSDEIARVVDREISALALFGSRYSSPRWMVDSLAAVSDAASAQVASLEELRESYRRFSEVAGFFAVPNFSIGVEHPSRRKKKKSRKPHPESGKVVVRRKTRRTLLGIVVTDMRVGSGGIKRTAQLGITVQAPRRRKYGNK